MKKNIVKDKSFEFALIIINCYKFLVTEKKEYVLSKQLLRSGTSIGANIRESEHGQSKADFIHKLSISLKEANETEYWIELLHKSDYLDDKQFEQLSDAVIELIKLLTSIIKTSKQNK